MSSIGFDFSKNHSEKPADAAFPDFKKTHDHFGGGVSGENETPNKKSSVRKKRDLTGTPRSEFPSPAASQKIPEQQQPMQHRQSSQSLSCLHGNSSSQHPPPSSETEQQHAAVAAESAKPGVINGICTVEKIPNKKMRKKAFTTK